jgi:O-antigen ligase
VLVLLRLERKQSPEMTRALWIPTIWMLYTASKPIGVWFSSSGGDPESGSPLDRIFLIVLMCVAFWILARRKYDWRSSIKENAWLMILIFFMLVSILWSNMPYISFKRWTREFQAVLMAFVVHSESSPRQAMESILRRTTYILIPFSLLLIKYFHKYGVDYGHWSGLQSWKGVALQKNGLGRLCLIATFFLIWSLVRRRKRNNPPFWSIHTYVEIFILLISFYLLRGPEGAYSATAITALGIGLLVYLAFLLMNKFGYKFSSRTLMSIMAIIIVYAIATLFGGGSSLKFYVSSVGRDATLTGRTEIWETLLPVAMQRAIIGRGFGGFWTPRTRVAFDASEGHSGYLDVLLDLGFVGILLFSSFLISSCRKAHRDISHDFDWSVLWICFLIMAVVHNITESSINSLTSHLTAVLLFLAVSSTSVISRVK